MGCTSAYTRHSGVGFRVGYRIQGLDVAKSVAVGVEYVSGGHMYLYL